MKVVATTAFHDNLKNVDRKRGEEFVVSRERYEQINEVGMRKIGRPIVEIVPAKKTSPETEAAKSRARRRKAASK